MQPLAILDVKYLSQAVSHDRVRHEKNAQNPQNPITGRPAEKLNRQARLPHLFPPASTIGGLDPGQNRVQPLVVLQPFRAFLGLFPSS
jgi:hypothetical protein